MAGSESTAQFLPLTDKTLQVLLSLAEGDTHGYGVLKRIRSNTAGRVELSVSTLYAVIQRLERDRLIEESDVRPDPALDDERRRYYRLTRLGQAVCEAELERLEQIVADSRHLRPIRGA